MSIRGTRLCLLSFIALSFGAFGDLPKEEYQLSIHTQRNAPKRDAQVYETGRRIYAVSNNNLGPTLSKLNQMELSSPSLEVAVVDHHQFERPESFVVFHKPFRSELEVIPLTSREDQFSLSYRIIFSITQLPTPRR